MLLESGMFASEEMIDEFYMDLIPLDDDLLSLELPQNFRNHLLQEDDADKF